MAVSVFELHRYTDGQWKERGVGEIKILKHTDSGQMRLLMRREQVLKICLNQRLSDDIDLKPMARSEGKAWVWHADDYSEGEIKHEQLAIRFKTKDIADQFKRAIEDAKVGKLVTPVKVTTPEGEKTDDKVTTPAKEPSPGVKPKTLLDSFNFTTPSQSTTTTSTTSTFKFGEATFSFGSSTTFGGTVPSASGFSFPKSLSSATPDTGSKETTVRSRRVSSSKSSLLANLLTSDDEEPETGI